MFGIIGNVRCRRTYRHIPGVEGDQGKWRTPHDHNRDYTEFLYPETAALASLIAETEPDIYLDFHNPGLRKKHNYVYTPHKAEMDPIEPAFSLLLEKYQEGNFNYKASDDMPFGVGWNTAKNYTDGLSAANWVNINIKSVRIAQSRFRSPSQRRHASTQRICVNLVTA